MAAKNKWVDRVILGTLLVTAPLGILCGFSGLSIFVGSAWGSANLLVLKHLIHEMMMREKKNLLYLWMLIFLKCPCLYVAGYFLLNAPQLSTDYLCLGFSLMFVVMGLMSFHLWLSNNTFSDKKRRNRRTPKPRA